MTGIVIVSPVEGWVHDNPLSNLVICVAVGLDHLTTPITPKNDRIMNAWVLSPADPHISAIEGCRMERTRTCPDANGGSVRSRRTGAASRVSRTNAFMSSPFDRVASKREPQPAIAFHPLFQKTLVCLHELDHQALTVNGDPGNGTHLPGRVAATSLGRSAVRTP